MLRYLGNWSRAPRLLWGRDAGCPFPTLTCARYSQDVPRQPYFCDTSLYGTLCTYNARSFGVCYQVRQPVMKGK